MSAKILVRKIEKFEIISRKLRGGDLYGKF